MEQKRNHYEVAIPHVASLYLRHNWNGTIQSLNEFAPTDIPPVPIVFFAFRIMVGLGVMMATVGIASLFVRRRCRLYTTRWLQRIVVLIAPAGFMAMLAGWVVTETGRQPFTVYGVLRTADSSSGQSLSFVMTSTLCILVVYTMVFGIGLVYMLRAMAKTPEAGEKGPEPSLASGTGK
jgi:cytochrome d ubiquinol oxidase subunit I